MEWWGYLFWFAIGFFIGWKLIGKKTKIQNKSELNKTGGQNDTLEEKGN